MGFQKHYRHPLAVLTGLLISSIAILAAANLWYLRKLQSESIHTAAAQTVLDLGTELARHLAGQPMVQPQYDETRRWEDFGRLVHSLHQIEPSLQYVAVNEGDVILFHEDTAATAASTNRPASPVRESVRVGRRLLATGGIPAPILTFTVPVPGAPARLIQVALRKEAVTQREERAARVLSLMFRLSVVTLAIAFGLAVLLAVWAVRHEQERQRRQRDAEHLAFAGTLADGIIHDVRNPMSSLRLDIQMLEKETGKGPATRPDRVAELAARARKTMDRVDLVMKEFLYVSRPTPAERERVDVNACIRDCLDLLGPRFERAEVRVQPHLDAAPLVVMGQSVALKRALINVLTNAKEASPKGATVTVSSRGGGGRVIVTVEDEGKGIPEGDLKRIFDMFVTGRPGGVGLGLYLAKAAVEHSDGQIVAENRAEGGARFVIQLPAGG